MSDAIHTLRDQLAPIAAKQREGHSLIRVVSQITVTLKPIERRDRFKEVVREVVQWMARRAGRKLPDEAWEGESFELTDVGAQRAAAIHLKDQRYWTARVDDADKSIPLRTWITEVGVGVDSSDDVQFGVRLICATRGADPPFDRTIPGFTKPLLKSGAIKLDGVAIPKIPICLQSERDIDEFVALLESRSRICDVIAIALPDDSSDMNQALLSPGELHEMTLGGAHVYAIADPGSYLLTNRVGKELSVFRGAVRTYRPGFRSWLSEPSDHPVALPNRIQAWHPEGIAGFERWLVNQALGNAAYVSGREERLPSFNSVKQLASQLERERARSGGATEKELLQLAESEISGLRKELVQQKQEYDGLLSAGDIEREDLRREVDAVRAKAGQRLHRIKLLERRLASAETLERVPIPDSLEGFEDWCEENLRGAVELASKAFQGVRKSEFHDPTLIYKALILLRDFYAPMRTEVTPERRQAYEAELRALKLEESPTGEALKYSDELYSIQYGGVRRLLDRHLKGGDSRDRRYCFRLYFFWDEEQEMAVVGWMPSHLDSRLS